MSSGSARLQHAMKTLHEHWELTRAQWDDQVARDFEKNHLEPLDHMVKHALRGMQTISEVLSMARRDCAE
ncbi:MAG: hypothetical protein AB7I30_13550 [Isosphaeraceae bacterium]